MELSKLKSSKEKLEKLSGVIESIFDKDSIHLDRYWRIINSKRKCSDVRDDVDTKSSLIRSNIK